MIIIPNLQLKFDWFTYMNNILTTPGVDIPLDENEVVIVEAVPYFQKLFNTLKKYKTRYNMYMYALRI